jgi:hypothetical protein
LHGAPPARCWSATSPEEPLLDAAAPLSRPGLRPATAGLLLVLGLLLHARGLSGPFPDGQQGNCGAMFSIFARNEHALGGLIATRGVPVVNPVPPPSLAAAEFYTHHPPGLPWLVMAAARLPLPVETAARLVALLASLATVLLLADLGCRLAGRFAGLAAGLMALALPATLHHGLLVNYETVAVPAMLLAVRALALRAGPAWPATALAGLMDWIALVPLALAWRSVERRRWWVAVAAAASMVLLFVLLGRLVAPASLAETLAQARGASPLAPDFDAGAWLAGQAGHLVTLFGWALVPAVLAPLTWRRRSALQRRVLAWLAIAGLLNVTLFARHATGHEHYALLWLPYVALATAVLLFPRDEAATPSRSVGLLALLMLLAFSWQQYRDAAPGREATTQAALADSLAAVTSTDTVYVRPSGASFVFLHRAQRHVAPDAVASLEDARAALERYRRRFDLAGLPGALAVAGDEPRPQWIPETGPVSERDGWRFYSLPEPERP